MKRIILALTLLCGSTIAHADLNIFACEPEWGALAQEIGGDKVTAYNATTGLQDPHHIEARPSLIAKARQADMLACTGAELEIGWLPLLLEKSGNAAIQEGQPGHFMAAQQVQLLDIPAKVDRSMGDVHADGNPHFQTDPRRIALVAKALAARMAQVDAANAAHYQQGYAAFNARWQQAMQGWQSKAAGLRGKAIVVHHKSWVYLEDWLGLKEIATLEPKPGVPPTSSHLAAVLQQLQTTPASMVVYAAYQSPRSAQWLSGKAGIPAVMLPSTVGGTAEATDLFTLFDDIIRRLNQAQTAG
ncbi:zinc ABC transporter substrate-binding protein [Candidatus Thiothrix sp. Deng01]|uniref:Zinc ABC transporter substrate-binding protein n=1 Tax=Candidatus Thiothrix phosphatis TaxID=3112415 RepID=A0ABU6CY06_9GAMM|nr:zinc ABC transporter substrate-binding protein [Candidatus Thiothrix sp. Deng01]MEB4591650.1 zinc ABC transporter substrate-binding protein [Candidatus Thiothrix sp. Deng01]